MNNNKAFQNLMSGIFPAKMKSAKKELLFSELSSLLSSGLDFSSAFLLLISGEKNKRQKESLIDYTSISFQEEHWPTA